MRTKQNDTKKLFRKIGSCSSTYMYLLNREFGNPKEAEVRALGPLAGGIYKLGHQCGMLWGASMGVGAEAYRRFTDLSNAIAATIKATQNITASFVNKTDAMDCYELTDCNWNSKVGMAKYFITGKFLSCFNLAEEWTSDAIKSAKEGLDINEASLPGQCMSCASEVLKKMGAADEEAVMASGFAGGLGFSGNACGALSAAIWYKNLDRDVKKEYKMQNVEAEKVLEKFYAETDYEILCEKITGQRFNSVEEHTKYVKNGGCANLINSLAQV